MNFFPLLTVLNVMGPLDAIIVLNRNRVSHGSSDRKMKGSHRYLRYRRTRGNRRYVAEVGIEWTWEIATKHEAKSKRKHYW